jgi:hypothetical protein
MSFTSGKGDQFLRPRLVGHSAKDVHDIYGGWVPMAMLAPLLEANRIDGSFSLHEKLQ